MSADIRFIARETVDAGGRRETDAISFDLDRNLPSPFFFPIFDIGIADAGFRLGPTVDIDARFGLPIGVELDIGAVDIGMDIDLPEAIPARNDPFRGIVFDLSDYTATTTLAAPGIDLATSSVDLGIDVEIASSVVFDARFTADVDGTGRDPDISIGTQIPLFDLPTFRVDETLLEFTGSDLSGSFEADFWDIGSRFGAAVADTGEATARDSLPTATAGGDLDPVLEGRINLAAALGSIFAIPPELFEGGFSFGLGRFLDIELSYTTLATDLRFEAFLTQDYSFTPTAIDVVLTASDGQRREGQLGDVFEFDVPEGTGVLDVTAEYTLSGDLASDFALDQEAFFDIIVGLIEVDGFVDIEIDPPGTGRSPDIDIERSFDFDIGPLLSETFELPSFPPFSLGGSRQSVVLAPVVVEYAIPFERFFAASDEDDDITFTPTQFNLNAGAGNDRIVGNDGFNLIDGGTGDDTIFGEGFRDQIAGGDGADFISGGDGDDLLTGGNGSDTVEGDAGDDEVRGNDGEDTLSGGLGDDDLIGARGSDTLLGGPGEDILSGEDASIPDDEAGDDFLDGGADDDRSFGGPGNDTFIGGPGDDEMTGGSGDDVFRDLLDREFIDGGPGIDTLDFRNEDTAVLVLLPSFSAFDFGGDFQASVFSIERVLGSDFDDEISGIFAGNQPTPTPPSIFETFPDFPGNSGVRVNEDTFFVEAGAGDDTIFGSNADDTIDGGEGDDTILMAPDGNLPSFFPFSDDLLIGGPGDDIIEGRLTGGTDTVLGGPGNDTITGFIGDVVIAPGTGNDTVTLSDRVDFVGDLPRTTARVVYEGGVDTYSVERTPGTFNTVDFSELNAGITFRLGFNGFQNMPGGRLDARGFDAVLGTEFDDVLSTVGGGPGRIEGGGGADRLIASAPNTTLVGGADADTYQGGFGADIFESWGDGAVDVLTGGAGADIFRVTARPTARDVITDFQPGFDQVDLSAILTPQSVVQTRETPEGLELLVTEPGGTFAVALFEGLSEAPTGADLAPGLPTARLVVVGDAVEEGGDATARILLDRPAPASGTQVDLLIDSGSGGLDRRTVTVPAGASETAVDIATTDVPGVGPDTRLAVSLLPGTGVFVDTGAEPVGITVLDNDPVQALDDAVAVAAQGAARFDPRLNDAARLGEQLAVVELNGQSVAPGASVALPSGASVTLIPTGELLYDPGGTLVALPAGAVATDTFTYRAEGMRGGLSDPATITVTVVGGAAPALDDDLLTVSEDSMDAGLPVEANDAAGGPPVRIGGEIIAPGRPVESAGGATFRLDGGLRFDANGAFDALPEGASETLVFTYRVALPSSLGAAGRIDAFEDTVPFAAPGVAGTGHRVTALGDLDGDGQSDFLVAATGESFVVSGGAGRAAVEDLTKPGTALRLTGSLSSAAAGDVDGDGISDLVFVRSGPGGPSVGVLFGAPDLDGQLDLGALGARGVILDQDLPPGALSGPAPAIGAGDVDGDGRADIVVGPDAGGALTILWGASDRASLGTAQVTLAAGAAAGVLVGDVNGDGRADIAAAADPGSPEIGAILYGSDAPVNVTDGVNGFTLIHDSAGFHATGMPWTITGLGDVSGDGVGDLGVVSPDSSRAAVVFGRSEPVPGGAIDLAALDGTDGFRIEPTGVSLTLAGAGDLNGDGTGDLSIGIVRPDALNEIAVVFGGADSGASLDLAALDGQTGFTMAETPFAGVARGIGTILEGVGDVTGDGVDDLAIGAGLDRRALLLEGRATPAPRPDAQPEELDEGDLSPAAQVILQILGENDAPLAAPDTAEAQAGLPFEIALSTLLANDTDFDAGDVLSVAEIGGEAAVPGAVVPLPDGAELILTEAGTLQLQENGAFDVLPVGGSTSIAVPVTIADTAGATATADLTLTVRAANRPPEARDDVVQLLIVNGPFDSVFIDVLANDTDPEGSPLRIVGVTDGASGIGRIDGQDTLSYISLDGSLGTDTLSYTVADAQGATATAQVTIDRRAEAPDLVVAADVFETSEDAGATVIGNLLDNDTGAPGLPLSIVAVALPFDTVPIGIATELSLGGTLTVAPDGTVIFDPAGDFETLGFNPQPEPPAETLAFNYSATDGFSVVFGRAEIDIRGANDAPKFTSVAAFTVAEGATSVGQVTASDVDAGDVLSFAFAGGDDDGAFVLDAAGDLAFAAAPDFEAPTDTGGDNVYDLRVSVSDGTDTVVKDIAVTVTDVPEMMFVEGTSGFDILTGTVADETIRGFGGPIDIVTGGGGADEFQFFDSAGRDVLRITDYDRAQGDVLNVAGESFQVRQLGNDTYLALDGPDRDLIIIDGLTDPVNDLTFV